jgi:hypothetical protein
MKKSVHIHMCPAGKIVTIIYTGADAGFAQRSSASASLIAQIYSFSFDLNTILEKRNVRSNYIQDLYSWLYNSLDIMPPTVPLNIG